MDTSLWSAGRVTHLKIVLVSLIASIGVVVVGISGHLDRKATTARADADSTVVVKAGIPRHYSEIDKSNIR